LRHLGCQGATIQHRGGRALHQGERYIKESESQWAESVANGDALRGGAHSRPLAAVATVLTLGLWNMVWGRSAITSQALMRWRVALQFIALCLVMAALYLSVK
jgi:Hypoxia induced protein conserved region